MSNSLGDLYVRLQNQIDILETILDDTDTLAQGLDKLSIPVENLSEPNYYDIDHYQQSAFRKVTFRFKKVPEIHHPFLESKKGEKVSYEELCTFLRDYITMNKLVNSDRTIVCDELLKKICDKDTVSFAGLLKCFNKIIQ